MTSNYKLNPEYTSAYTLADTLKIKTDDVTTTAPDTAYDFPVVSDKIFLWDNFGLQNIFGERVKYKGWYVLFALMVDTENRDVNTVDQWSKRNDSAYLGVLVSRDGKSWVNKGRVLEKSADLRPYEWSGSCFLEDSTGAVTILYTSVNDKEQVPCYIKGKIIADDNDISFTGFSKTVEMIHPDNITCAAPDLNPYAALRDPNIFYDPRTKRTYVIFETDLPKRGELPIPEVNLGNLPESYDISKADPYRTGGIGIALINNTIDHSAKPLDHLDSLTMLPPLIDAYGVNTQLEMPKIFYYKDKYYLFTITHKSMFDSGVVAPDGLYGFVADSLFGEWKPLNGSGLVVGNSSKQPVGRYAFNLYIDNDNVYVHNFLDTIPNPNGDGSSKIGGTLGKTIQIKIEGSNTYVLGELDYGELPVSKNVA